MSDSDNTLTIEYGLVALEKRGKIAIARMRRENKLNAINEELAKGIRSALEDVSKDEKVRLAILTGTGKAFSAGTDVVAMKDWDALKGRKDFSGLLCDAIYNFEKPLVAMINGFALGGGLEMALSCDIRIASDDAKFGFPEIKLGHVPAGGGGPQLLSRAVGRGNAMLLALTGDTIDSQRALQIGLIDIVFPKDKLQEETLKLAENIVAKDSAALQLTKALVQIADEVSVSFGRKYERELVGISFTTKAHEEGMKAFFEKRQPRF